MPGHELELTIATVVRAPDSCLGDRLPILDATETTGDAVRKPPCDTADKNTVARATKTSTADPTLPGMPL